MTDIMAGRILSVVNARLSRDGLTRLLRNMYISPLAGSTQKPVPVNPMWPNVEASAWGAVGDLSGSDMSGLSNPRPRRERGLLAVVNSLTVSADETDARKLLDAIDGGQPEGITDLNGDGAVNLVDLEYYTRGLPENRDTLAKQEKFVPAAVITALADSGTKAEGNLNTFLRDGTGLRLSPANGGEIDRKSVV